MAFWPQEIAFLFYVFKYKAWLNCSNIWMLLCVIVFNLCLMCHSPVLPKVIGDACLCLCRTLTVPLPSSYDKWHCVLSLLHTHIHTHPTYARSDVIVIHPLTEVVTFIKLAIVSFPLGWRKERYFSADVWPTHTRRLSMAICIKVTPQVDLLCITYCTIYICNEELYHCLQCTSVIFIELGNWDTHFPAHTQWSGVLVSAAHICAVYI